MQEEMLAFINSTRSLCVVFDFTKSPASMHGVMDFLVQPTALSALSIVSIVSYAYVINT